MGSYPPQPSSISSGALTETRVQTATVLVSLVTLLTPMASSMIAPAAVAIAVELHIRTIILNELIFSIFLLGYVIGPLFLAPSSEVFGRANVLRLATWVSRTKHIQISY